MKQLLFFVLFIPFISNAQIISTVAGNGHYGYTGDDSSALLAKLDQPNNVTIDDTGNIYIADRDNNVIRKVNSAGIIKTIVGYGLGGYSGDGGSAISAQLYYPTSVVLDDSGNIYIADGTNARIRKVNTLGIISTIAGNGIVGYTTDGVRADTTEIGYPYDIAIDHSGNIYIADADHHRIRKVNKVTGIITTVAGNGLGGYSGDSGPATNASLNRPFGLTIDRHNQIYIADANNNRIRKVDTNGVITTIAGFGIYPGYSGDGGPADSAQIWFPIDVAVDTIGNVYISEYGGQRIRKIDVHGIISNFAGDGKDAGTNGGGFKGDGGKADTAEFHLPCGICVDKYGNVFVADQNNHRIRKITIDTTISFVSSIQSQFGINFYPNPSQNGIFYRKTDKGLAESNFEVYNLLGQKIDFVSTDKYIDISANKNGIYFYRLILNGEIILGKLLYQ